MRTYNNYCGNFNMEYIFYNEWSDPEIIYKGFKFSAPMVEGDLYNMYLEEYGAEPSTDAALTAYIGNCVQDVLEDMLCNIDVEFIREHSSMNFETLRDAAIVDAQNNGEDYWGAVEYYENDDAVVEHFRGVSFVSDDFCS